MDEIIGIAILTRTVPQELLIACRKASGKIIFYSKIPVYPVGGTKPAEDAWAYRIEGDQLHVTPSVHVRYQLPPDETWHTRFHNAGAWSVRFQWAESVEPAQIHEQMKAANPDIKFSHEL